MARKKGKCEWETYLLGHGSFAHGSVFSASPMQYLLSIGSGLEHVLE